MITVKQTGGEINIHFNPKLRAGLAFVFPMILIVSSVQQIYGKGNFLTLVLFIAVYIYALRMSDDKTVTLLRLNSKDKWIELTRQKSHKVDQIQINGQLYLDIDGYFKWDTKSRIPVFMAYLSDSEKLIHVYEDLNYREIKELTAELTRLEQSLNINMDERSKFILQNNAYPLDVIYIWASLQMLSFAGSGFFIEKIFNTFNIEADHNAQFFLLLILAAPPLLLTFICHVGLRMAGYKLTSCDVVSQIKDISTDRLKRIKELTKKPYLKDKKLVKLKDILDTLAAHDQKELIAFLVNFGRDIPTITRADLEKSNSSISKEAIEKLFGKDSKLTLNPDQLEDIITFLGEKFTN